jgi:DNA-binding NtrC family response regulator
LQTGGNIELVLSDIAMPGGMNGIALAQEINNRYPQIPVLLNSAHSDMVQTAGSRFVVLRKPFQLATLEQSIREARERHGDRDKGGRVLQLSKHRVTVGGRSGESGGHSA